MTPEFSRPIKLDQIGGKGHVVALSATAEECVALAARFDLISLSSLTASLTVSREGEIVALSGEFSAAVTQACIASAEPVTVAIHELVHVRFVPDAPDGEEVELDSADCDVMEHDGQSIDLGEAIAQSLALALDPYPRSPNAEAALRTAGVKSEEDVRPLGALGVLLGQTKRD
jgi:uncharacterized metal-binding protein YceD (DUF177 family)